MSFREPLDNERFTHKSREFTLKRVEPNRWRITDPTGVDYGSIVMLTDDGADHDPVYNGYLANSDVFLHFGSDWDAIARSLINDYVAEHTIP